ncbi:MmgE/PrpD family protein [Methylobacterium terricola]|uniref:MmgE/PrpD family protein n=1 Tax=Methylobacterium terricola TaxID=2583531 RepID=A0A5C4LKI2_9HYPH|nr:MmgE/PrpD family protein [Methylobacterium terricola]TNC12887.1 MmgE/PrpD family protein [Methylobacterium terricola]
MTPLPAGADRPLCSALAEWSVGLRADALTPVARARARDAIIDVLGCIHAGARTGTVRTVAVSQAGAGRGPARAIGLDLGYPAASAALINGTAAHVLDYDDNFFPAITHASAVLVPALLALGDERGSPMEAVLLAYVAGLEIQARLGLRANPGHYEAGWHATSTLGTIGAAGACAKLLGLDVGETANALSLAASLAGGSKLQFGTSAKPAHAGFAAMHGVLAATLAAAGLDGCHGIFEGPWGFLAHHAGDGPGPAEDPSADGLAIERYGLVAKLYPSCMSSHLGIDGILALHGEAAIDPADVAGIHIEMPDFMIRNLRFTEPADGTEAKFSMNHCAAIAVIEGAPRIAHFTDACAHRADLRAIGRTVTMAPRRPDRSLPWGGDARVAIRTRSGSRREVVVRHPKGSIGNPLSDAEALAKFRDCCAMNLDPDAVAAVEEQVFGDWSRLDVAQVTRGFLHAGGGSGPGEQALTPARPSVDVDLGAELAPGAGMVAPDRPREI